MNIFSMILNIPILILLLIVVQSPYFSVQAKSAGISRNRSHSTYWTIHLLKLKRGVISFDCNAVLIPIHTPVSYQSKSANSSLSDILLTSAYCLHQKDARLGKMYVPNATQLSALFVERAPNGKMLNDLELRITNYLIHSKYSRGMPHDTVDVALIKLQTYLPVPKSFAAIPVSHFSLDEVSNCFVTGRLLSIPKDRDTFFSKMLNPRMWSLRMDQCRPYLNESGYIVPTVRVFAEPQKRGKFFEVDILERAQTTFVQFQGGGVSSLLFVTCASSNDQIYFTFTLGSPLICRNNGIDLLQGVIVSLHYFKSATITGLRFNNVHRLSSWIAEESEKMMKMP